MYHVEYTNRFKKDLKRCEKRGLDLRKVLEVICILKEKGKLPSCYRPHKLHGDKNGQWECHIEPDWLLVWEQNNDQMTLLFIQTGTHSDLF